MDLQVLHDIIAHNFSPMFVPDNMVSCVLSDGQLTLRIGGRSVTFDDSGRVTLISTSASGLFEPSSGVFTQRIAA